MGDVVSSHLDEAKREMISAQTGEVMTEFSRLYEQQYAVALFNNIRFDIEGGGGPQPQLLHRKTYMENKSIFSGSLFQYLEENKKWRNHFLFIPDTYNINYYDNKSSHDKRLHPKGTINCAGYKVLTSLEQYMDMISSSLPDVKAKLGSSPFLKCATQFPLILWHPYAHHYYFCVTTEEEQQKWHAVLQDCVRHTNDGLSEENKVQTPAFTDAVRLYRQAQGQYGTWDMMCGVPSQILSNLVMESLLPKLRELISPRLKGKSHDRQRNWMLISDAVYSLVQGQCQAQYEALLKKCEAARSSLEASIRTDMDQIITSKEHVTNKIRALILPKAEKLLKVSIQPYISSILDALMEPTSRGFFEVRDLFFRELVDMSKDTVNDGTKENVAQHMEKISMLAYHPVKMQSCYERVEQLSLEGLQQRFDVSSPSVFVQRAQILMREQMDDAVYTFEQILHQSLESPGMEELCKTIQRCQDRVIKKFDYDSSTVRKRFFREALLQIFIPYMLKQLSPSCCSELPRFQELIFEDFSRFILVESIFEEVVLQSVMKDIMMAVKEAAVQRRHNLYRDSIVLSNSDPSLHLLGENPSIDWTGEYGGAEEEAESTGEDEDGESHTRKRMKQVVSMIQVEGSPVLPNESCIEVPDVNVIPEEEDGGVEEITDGKASPGSPKASEKPPDLSNGSTSMEEKDKPEGKEVPMKVENATDIASVEKEEKDGGVEEITDGKASPGSPKASENPDLSNGSISTEETDKPEGKEMPMKVESATDIASVEKEEKDRGVEEITDGKASSGSPKATENPPDMSNGSISMDQKDKPEGKEEVSLKVETATDSASVVQGEKGKEEQLQSNQEVSGEAFPPPPPLEEISSSGTEMESPPEETADFPPPPHDDSGFQSPSSEGGEAEEEEAPGTVAPQPAEENPELMEKRVSAEAETKISDSETREQ